MSLDTYKAQKRGGKGVKGASSDEDFFTIFLLLKLMIN
jgi:DNA gyrase subunit A